MIFKEYKSKPVVRKAYEIKGHDRIYYYPDDSEATIAGTLFKCHEAPQVGDFVVCLNDNDSYHCPRKVFMERNHV